MIRKTVAGIVAVGLIAAGAASIAAPLARTGGTASHYSHAAGGNTNYLKAGITKNCLDNRDACGAVVW